MINDEEGGVTYTHISTDRSLARLPTSINHSRDGVAASDIVETR